MVKTTIYKIVCKNEEITDCYVGRTKDCTKRFQQHKTVCYNENKVSFNYRLYKTIRENGGFENWNIVEVETIEHEDADKTTPAEKEGFWFNELNATLNNNVPGRCKKESCKMWAEKNTEYRKIYAEKYRAENKEKIAEKTAVYYQENKEKSKAHTKKWVEDNRERNRIYQRERCRRIVAEKRAQLLPPEINN